MFFKKNKYKKINDIIYKDTIITNLYDDVFIKIVLENEKIVRCDYNGSFADVLGASFDLINGLITSYSSPDLDFTFWKFSIEHFDEFKSSGIYKELATPTLSGQIVFEIDSRTQNIDSKYSSNPLGYITMIAYFINSFCEEYNIDKKEYFEYLDNSRKYFVEHNAEKLMHITKLK